MMGTTRTTSKRWLLAAFVLLTALATGASAHIDRHRLDFAAFQECFGTTDQTCLSIFDFDAAGQSDGTIDLADFGGFDRRLNGPNTPPGGGCPIIPQGQRFIQGTNNPPTGTFALHGRPIDVLPDGKTLLYVRARYYDPINGRWLQRDPKGNIDGPNLYESFRGNAARFIDPMGREAQIVVAQDGNVTYQRTHGLVTASITEKFSIGRLLVAEDGRRFVTFVSPNVSDATILLGFDQLGHFTKIREADEALFASFAETYGTRISSFESAPVELELSGIEAFRRDAAGAFGDLAFQLGTESRARANSILISPEEFYGGAFYMAVTKETIGGDVISNAERRVAFAQLGLEIVPALGTLKGVRLRLPRAASRFSTGIPKVVPQGLTASQFNTAARLLRSSRAAQISDDIFVQGSRARGTAGPASDIDFGIRVSPQKFESLIQQRFSTLTPGSDRFRTN